MLKASLDREIQLTVKNEKATLSRDPVSGLISRLTLLALDLTGNWELLFSTP